MKHNGSLMEYSKERSDDLMRAYDEYIASCDYICMSDVYNKIVNMPSRRFWVSDLRATLVISGMIRGNAHLEKMCQSKREMYEEIYRRVLSLSERYPNKPIPELCAMAVVQPAPKFYLAPSSARIMVIKARKEWKKRKLRRLLRL